MSPYGDHTSQTHVAQRPGNDPRKEVFKMLLQEMFAGVRRHRETTLLAGFDGPGIVSAALQGLSVWDPVSVLADFRNSEMLKSAFNLVVRQVIDTQTELCGVDYRVHSLVRGGDAPAVALKPGLGFAAAQWLAEWLERFCSVMNDVHPRAIEVVMIRLEGCDYRRVGQRLGIPMRLARRIGRDIQDECDGGQCG